MPVLNEQVLWPVLVPVAAGVVCGVLPRALDRLRAILAVLGAAATVVPAWRLFAQSLALPAGGVLPCGSTWFRVDHLSAFVILAATVFGLIVALYSVGYMAGKERLREYYTYLLWTVGFSAGALAANHLIVLLIFWGMLGATLYLMVGMGGPDASAAAKKAFIVIGGTDCLLMLGIAMLWFLSGGSRGGTLEMSKISATFSAKLTYVAFLCFAVAAFAKAGAMPMHTWVPDCGEKAPVSVTAFLPASLDKLLGIYLLVRCTNGMFVMNDVTRGFLMLVGAGTVIAAVMMALIQHDLKRLLSYHAVSQVGYMILGIGTGTAVGLAGGLFHMFNNAVYKTCLFLCAGSVEKRAGTTDMDRLGGLAKAMPITFWCCLLASLAISGIPPMNGFVSKWMVYQGIVESGSAGGTMWVIWLATAMLGSALTLASFVKILHAVFLCKPAHAEARGAVREVGASMWIPMVVLAAGCVVSGVAAYALPLRYFVVPAVGDVRYIGEWLGGTAFVLMLAAFLLGLLVYALSRVRKARECPTYIGGEILDQSWVSGREPGRTGELEVTGTDFYRTVEETWPLRTLFALARNKVFDVYDVGTALVSWAARGLQKLHTGVVTHYVIGYLVGLAVLLFLIMRWM